MTARLNKANITAQILVSLTFLENAEYFGSMSKIRILVIVM